MKLSRSDSQLLYQIVAQIVYFFSDCCSDCFKKVLNFFFSIQIVSQLLVQLLLGSQLLYSTSLLEVNYVSFLEVTYFWGYFGNTFGIIALPSHPCFTLNRGMARNL